MDSHRNYVGMSTLDFNRILGAFRGVRGVRINCDDFVKERNVPIFEEVMIESYDLRDANFNWRDEFDPEKRATPLTLLNTNIALQAKWEHCRGDPIYSGIDIKKSIARLLLTPCEIGHHTFGNYNETHNIGNMIVMRKDRKPLDVKYMEIFCDWIEKRLWPLFRRAVAECRKLKSQGFHKLDLPREQRAIRERVFRIITKQNLLAYSRRRLRDEDTEDTEDEEMRDIIENEDTTDDEMPSRL